MRAFINRTISKIKGSDYALDKRIPTAYLLRLMLERAVMRLRGACSFISNDGLLFIGSGVIIRSRKNISLGKAVTIGRGCFIDALSTGGIIMGNNVSLGKKVTIECTGSLSHIGKGMLVGNSD